MVPAPDFIPVTPFHTHQANPVVAAVSPRKGKIQRATITLLSGILAVGLTAPLGAGHATAAQSDQSDSAPTEENDTQGKKTWDPFDLRDPDPIYVASPENRKPLARDNSADGHCERDPLASNMQRCDIYSYAMQRIIPIHFKPAVRGGHAALLLLDGASARDEFNRWIPRGRASAIMANTDISVIAPIGGGASWYANWQYPNCSPVHPDANPQRWETFITQELRTWGTQQGINPSLYSVAGFSMGGGSALMLAGRHHDMFKQALSYSGTTTFSIPGVQPILNLTEDWGPCLLSPFGTILNPTRYRLDPTLNVEKLRGIDVYASSANGLPRKTSDPIKIRRDMENGLWEVGSLILLRLFEKEAQEKNVPVTINYLGRGSHQYEDAARELRNTRHRILHVLKREERKLGPAAHPQSTSWKRLEKKLLMRALKDNATLSENNPPTSRVEARRHLTELRNTPAFRQGTTTLIHQYGEDTVVCLIQNDQLAWTRSLPAHPVVTQEAINNCRDSQEEHHNA